MLRRLTVKNLAKELKITDRALRMQP